MIPSWQLVENVQLLGGTGKRGVFQLVAQDDIGTYIHVALDPEKALEYYKTSNKTEGEFCTMCGPNFCAARISHSLKDCEK